MAQRFGERIDCSRPRSVDERAVCRAPRLQVLDRKVAELESRMGAPSDAAIQAHDAWINLRSGCRDSPNCLASRYEQRLESLKSQAAADPAPAVPQSYSPLPIDNPAPAESSGGQVAAPSTAPHGTPPPLPSHEVQYPTQSRESAGPNMPGPADSPAQSVGDARGAQDLDTAVLLDSDKSSMPGSPGSILNQGSGLFVALVLTAAALLRYFKKSAKTSPATRTLRQAPSPAPRGARPSASAEQIHERGVRWLQQLGITEEDVRTNDEHRRTAEILFGASEDLERAEELIARQEWAQAERELRVALVLLQIPFEAGHPDIDATNARLSQVLAAMGRKDDPGLLVSRGDFVAMAEAAKVVARNAGLSELTPALMLAGAVREAEGIGLWSFEIGASLGEGGVVLAKQLLADAGIHPALGQESNSRAPMPLSSDLRALIAENSRSGLAEFSFGLMRAMGAHGRHGKYYSPEATNPPSPEIDEGRQGTRIVSVLRFALVEPNPAILIPNVRLTFESLGLAPQCVCVSGVRSEGAILWQSVYTDAAEPAALPEPAEGFPNEEFETLQEYLDQAAGELVFDAICAGTGIDPDGVYFTAVDSMADSTVTNEIAIYIDQLATQGPGYVALVRDRARAYVVTPGKLVFWERTVYSADRSGELPYGSAQQLFAYLQDSTAVQVLVKPGTVLTKPAEA